MQGTDFVQTQYHFTGNYGQWSGITVIADGSWGRGRVWWACTFLSRSHIRHARTYVTTWCKLWRMLGTWLPAAKKKKTSKWREVKYSTSVTVDAQLGHSELFKYSTLPLQPLSRHSTAASPPCYNCASPNSKCFQCLWLLSWSVDQKAVTWI